MINKTFSKKLGKEFFLIGIFLDTETNGLDYRKHHIFECAFKFVDLDSGVVLISYETVIAHSEEIFNASDPESLAITEFTYDEISMGRDKKQVSEEIQAIFAQYKIQRGNSVFICQNPTFDRMFFSELVEIDIQEKKQWPYHWLDLASMYFALALKTRNTKPWVTGISKNDIAKQYSVPDEQNPHRAMNGVDHLMACYEKVIGFNS